MEKGTWDTTYCFHLSLMEHLSFNTCLTEEKHIYLKQYLQTVHKMDLILDHLKATYTVLVLFNVFLDYYVDRGFYVACLSHLVCFSVSLS